ncbi:hypothetical protein Dimus_039423 [Dionaea muscipula]
MYMRPLCIDYPEANTEFELKIGVIHLLPKFQGLSEDDPYTFLKEFNQVCSSCKTPEVTIEQVMLRAFPFALTDAAKDWLYYLPSGSVSRWEDMQALFLERFFPASRTTIACKEIVGNP